MFAHYSVLVSAMLSGAVALPQMIIPSPTYYCPIVDRTELIGGDPWQVGLSVSGGGELALSESHEVGTTWEIGGDIGVSTDTVISAAASFSISVSETVTDSVSEQGSYTCPDGAWHCSLMVIPGMTRVYGHMEELGADDGCDVDTISQWDGGEEGPFQVVIPTVDDGGNAPFDVEMCTCENLLDWADPGHVARLCPEDCVNPEAS